MRDSHAAEDAMITILSLTNPTATLARRGLLTAAVLALAMAAAHAQQSFRPRKKPPMPS
jgi:hypothetical protein